MSRRRTTVPEVSVTGQAAKRFSMARLRALMAGPGRDAFSRLDEGAPEKLGSRLVESRFDRQVFIEVYTKQLRNLFDRLIRTHEKKLQKSADAQSKCCAVPQANNESHKRT